MPLKLVPCGGSTIFLEDDFDTMPDLFTLATAAFEAHERLMAACDALEKGKPPFLRIVT